VNVLVERINADSDEFDRASISVPVNVAEEARRATLANVRVTTPSRVVPRSRNPGASHRRRLSPPHPHPRRHGTDSQMERPELDLARCSSLDRSRDGPLDAAGPKAL
jgi:hypothetical protein